VTGDHWKLIDDFERSAGEKLGRPRVKVTSLAELLRITHG
jgi:ferredoxin--NADP+ reductase